MIRKSSSGYSQKKHNIFFIYSGDTIGMHVEKYVKYCRIFIHYSPDLEYVKGAFRYAQQMMVQLILNPWNSKTE